jgi:MFS family permease
LIAAASEHYSTLLVGRLIIGFGGGLALVTAPVYASELAPPQYRGVIVSSIEIATNVGTLLGYLAAMVVTMPYVGKDVGWRIATGLAALPAVLALVQLGVLSESPRWLLKVQRRDEALQILGDLMQKQDAKELCDLVNKMEEDIRTERQQASWRELLCPSAVVLRMLIAGIGCAFFQQAVGMEALIYNTPKILKSFGVKAIEDINYASVFIGLVPIIGAFMGAFAFDTIGRRACLLTSLILSFLSLGGLQALLAFDVQQPVMSVIFLCAISFSVDMGLAPGMLVIGTESYPVAIRAKGLALGLFVNRLMSGIMTFAFPVLWHRIGLNGLLTCFTSISFLGIIWAWFCVPEGVGLSLEEVSRLYQQPVRRKSTRSTSKDIEDAPGTAVAIPRSKLKKYGATDVNKFAEFSY